MSTFDKAVEFVLDQEGEFSDDPADPGGVTHWGISQRAFPGINVRNLTRLDCIAIYKRQFWDEIHGDSLPPSLAIILFDTAVNQGVLAATRLFQLAIGVKADGIMGPVTLQAAAGISASKAVTEFIARRCNAYALNPLVTRYGLGWFRRVSAIHQLSTEIL